MLGVCKLGLSTASSCPCAGVKDVDTGARLYIRERRIAARVHASIVATELIVLIDPVNLQVREIQSGKMLMDCQML
jgi:hypothetical protein